MIGIRKLALSAAAAAAATLTVAALSTTPAFADNGGHGDNVVRAALVGSTPAVSPTIAGIAPGGAPWVNGPSSVRVRESGRIDVRIRGLIIPALGMNPVASVVATLVCGDQVGPSTQPFALSTAGNGRTRDHIRVPRDCDDAVVLIQPAANTHVYIASTTAMGDDD